MKLRNSGYSALANKIKENNCRIIVYGAGMIGQIVVPHIIDHYGLYGYMDCYVDMDQTKKGKKISIGAYEYEIRQPEILMKEIDNLVLLITNSKFYSVVEYLDGVDSLKNAEAYIIPIMQIYELQHAEPVKICNMNDKPLIPRIIHYCWFVQKKKPEFLVQCMNTWREKCPDYQIVEWNETNYDVNKIPYVKEAYHEKKYGFVTDIARLDILYEHGGVYMDTDVMLLKNLDLLLYQSAFVGVEKWGNVNTGGLTGAIPRHPMIKEMLDYRKQFHFQKEDGSLNIETNGMYETVPFLRHGMRVDNTLQIINGVTVYPSSVFHPYDYMSCESQIQSCTFSKHYFYGGWMDESDLENRENTQSKYRQILRRMSDERSGE